jgi:two-component SAPR family response regulator
VHEAYLHLIASAVAKDRGDVIRAAALAAAAVASADRSGCWPTRLLTRIALIELGGLSRSQAAVDFEDGLPEIEDQALRSAIARWLKKEAHVGHTIEPLIEHFQNIRPAPLVLFIIGGRIEQQGREIALTPRESELLCYLGIERRTIDRDSMLEDLFGGHDAGGRNQLKVYVSRVRRTLGRETIETRGSGYALGRHVTVDLDDIDALLKISPRTEEIVQRLRAYSDRLSEAARPAWPWAVRHESRLARIETALHRTLSEGELAARHYAQALFFVRRAITRDPFDEAARRLAVDIHIAAKDVHAARKEFESFRRFLREELGSDANSEFVREIDRAAEPTSFTIPTEMGRKSHMPQID